MTTKFAGIHRHNGINIKMVTRLGEVYLCKKDVELSLQLQSKENEKPIATVINGNLNCFGVISLPCAIKMRPDVGWVFSCYAAVVDSVASFVATVTINDIHVTIYASDDNIYIDGYDLIFQESSLHWIGTTMVPSFDIAGNYSRRCMVDELTLYLTSPRYSPEDREHVLAVVEQYRNKLAAVTKLAERVDASMRE